MLVLASQQQEQECGDGTNFVLVFAGALLEQAEQLLRMVCLVFDIMILSSLAFVLCSWIFILEGFGCIVFHLVECLLMLLISALNNFPLLWVNTICLWMKWIPDSSVLQCLLIQLFCLLCYWPHSWWAVVVTTPTYICMAISVYSTRGGRMSTDYRRCCGRS